METLAKADPETADLLARIRSGQTRPEDAELLDRKLYSDTLLPNFRNRAAFQDHMLDFGNHGVHAAIDLNSLGMINKLHGEVMGDKAIKDLGDIVHRNASKYHGKVFRQGGDEMHATFLEPDHAHQFARDFEKQAEDYHKANGPIGGTHRLGAAVGIGWSHQHAGRALIEAKKKLYDQDEVGKRTPKYDFKEMPSTIHSALGESQPPGWKSIEQVIKEKRKTPVEGANLTQEPKSPAASTHSVHMPGTATMTGNHTQVHYTQEPTDYSYTKPGLKLSNPLGKSESGHPAVSGGHVGIMSGENPMYPAEKHGTEALIKELQDRGLKSEVVAGKYGGRPEMSVIVRAPDLQTMRDLGHQFGQESVIFSQDGIHQMHYTNGPKKDHFVPGKGNQVSKEMPDDNFTRIEHQGVPQYFSYNLDFDKLIPARMAIPGPHPHGYDWDPAASSKLSKAETGNEQAPGGKQSAFGPIVAPFGTTKPGTRTSMNHYDYAPHEADIDNLIARHGYRVNYMGGKHGLPDMSKDHYGSGVLHIWNPEAGSGGDFGDEATTRGWCKIHELAHALTLPAVNAQFGDGRRIGKLGVHRTPNEAKRAVAWEDAAVAKQRELSAQIGHHIPDELYHRERNAVLADATHRAITGKFSEPSEEGFIPHQHHVPIEEAFKQIDAHAANMGLGPHDTLKTKARSV